MSTESLVCSIEQARSGLKMVVQQHTCHASLTSTYFRTRRTPRGAAWAAHKGGGFPAQDTSWLPMMLGFCQGLGGTAGDPAFRCDHGVDDCRRRRVGRLAVGG